ncbi:Ribosomal protein S5 domain 2-type fold [Acididesulfobacillus acetoxydans]|uniref:Lon protease n=1 Tax=Acididesulfobacillus acetoxydans TaxID=1561005 RepID=A0A8S0WDQ5_9FIRM|nr:endopeptidase La [Acididesulfobacillus acetoxydans]CAA7599452.1 Ribosomal protein S5 domain 2-type fold [Acididesulfobacillus acetoxydans]CEJ06743.1 Lon protease [Acididesulfobacillus acetoxydans]
MTKKRELPLLPLRGILVFPYMVIHLDVGRERSMAAIDEAMLRDRMILLAAQKETDIDSPTVADIYTVGTIAEVKQLLKLPGGTMRVLVEGIARGKIKEFLAEEPFFQVRVEEYAEGPGPMTPDLEALTRGVTDQFEEYAKLGKKVPSEAVGAVLAVEEPGRLADIVASHLNLKVAEKQVVLEALDVEERLERLTEFIMREIEILELERRIGLRVRKQMEKAQKEYYLREQIKAIQKELGEKDERQAEADELREKVAKAKLPKEVEEKALKEIERLEKMPPASAEGTVVRTYLDWLLVLPWNKATRDKTDLIRAEEILNEDHYGLQKVKERILEFLAIRKLTPKMKSPILCFVGPPGVGKTSLAKSVARALERKFVRMSLGGVRDEAEIRGHRRTYIGALPGRVIQGLRTAGTRNPVYLFDEIDKMTMDFRGDPSSALLEVLDPEQNNTFSDHYLEVPFDLSHTLFILTANTMHTIPRPLLDRMEVISLSGYTEDEKVHIAQRYLVPKQLKAHGLNSEILSIDRNILLKLVQGYTRESGVRNLEREVASLCRKVATRWVKKEWEPHVLNEEDLEEMLGAPRYHVQLAAREPEVGAATGLAYTEVGGDILTIEVTPLPGKGNLTLTGKLGDVMKESAQAGWTFVRAHAAELGIPEDFYDKVDLHIHVPEGAIPKDGPSAGITMAAAMASALSKRAVRCDLAMTGEITLRGNVLPIGGLKEKVLAAHRSGIKVILVPEENRKDLEEVPENVREAIEFHFVSRMEEVLELALLPVRTDGYEVPLAPLFAPGVLPVPAPAGDQPVSKPL